MEKTALFYMANAYPEIRRVLRYAQENDTTGAEAAKDRALAVIDAIIARDDVPAAGREEWSAIRSLLTGYQTLDDYTRKVLEKFAEPFSLKFMYEYTHGNR